MREFEKEIQAFCHQYDKVYSVKHFDKLFQVGNFINHQAIGDLSSGTHLQSGLRVSIQVINKEYVFQSLKRE